MPAGAARLGQSRGRGMLERVPTASTHVVWSFTQLSPPCAHVASDGSYQCAFGGDILFAALLGPLLAAAAAALLQRKGVDRGRRLGGGGLGPARVGLGALDFACEAMQDKK
jgi:hypothetical protein